MNYQEITKYYGKTAMIYHSLGVLMFDNPVKIFPESEQGKRRRYYLRILDGKEDRIVRVHAIGKIEVSEQFYLVKRRPSEYLEDLREFEDFIDSLEVKE